jgi:hypothetical protein
MSLASFLFAATTASAQMRASPNIRWDCLRNHQFALEQVAAGWEVKLGGELSSLWKVLSDTEMPLQAEAERLDAEEARLLARARGLREECVALIPQRERLVTWQTQLQTERAQLESVRPSASAPRAAVAAFDGKVVDFNARLQECDRQAGDFNNRLVYPLNTRIQRYNQDWNAFAGGNDAYISHITAWERRFDDVVRLQLAEEARLRDLAAQQHKKPPSLEQAKPSLNPNTASRFNVVLERSSARTAYNSFLHSAQERSDAITDIVVFGAHAAKLEPYAWAVIAEEGLMKVSDAALRAEARRTRDGSEQLRRLPEVLRHIDHKKTELETRVRRGEITESEMRTRLGAFARGEAYKRGFLTATKEGSSAVNQNNRLWEDLCSPEVGHDSKVFLASVAGSESLRLVAKSKMVTGALSQEWGDAARRVSDNSKSVIAPTGALFQHSFEGAAHLVGKSVVSAFDIPSESQVPELRAKPAVTP